MKTRFQRMWSTFWRSQYPCIMIRATLLVLLLLHRHYLMKKVMYCWYTISVIRVKQFWFFLIFDLWFNYFIFYVFVYARFIFVLLNFTLTHTNTNRIGHNTVWPLKLLNMFCRSCLKSKTSTWIDIRSGKSVQRSHSARLALQGNDLVDTELSLYLSIFFYQHLWYFYLFMGV